MLRVAIVRRSYVDRSRYIATVRDEIPAHKRVLDRPDPDP